MAADGGDAAAEKSPFRCIHAARYVVASVVAALIVAVIVSAITVVLRPESLILSVTGGGVLSVTRIPSSSPPALGVELGLRSENPAGRARMYYIDITAYVFDKNVSAWSTTNPEDDCILFFPLDDEVVAQQKVVLPSVKVKMSNDSMESSYFNELYNGRSSIVFTDLTMRLDGTLKTELRSGLNATSRNTTYYCRPLLLGVASDVEAFKNRQDVVCTPSA